MRKILAISAAFAAFLTASAKTEAQHLMVDQKGNIEPAGAVATIADTVKTETKLAALEVASVAYTNAAAQTSQAVDDLASAIIGNSLVVYEDDFIYSHGDAIRRPRKVSGIYSAQIVAPILADGEIVGGLILLSRESGLQMTDIDQKVAETTANIIGRQMEQ